jgi:hypothetical protein
MPALPSGFGLVLTPRRAIPDALALPRPMSARGRTARRAEGVPLKLWRKLSQIREDAGRRSGKTQRWLSTDG